MPFMISGMTDVQLETEAGVGKPSRTGLPGVLFGIGGWCEANQRDLLHDERGSNSAPRKASNFRSLPACKVQMRNQACRVRQTDSNQR